MVLKNLSKEEDISIRYLEQIIIPLKLNNLVKSIRGAGGGYKLAKHPSEIKLVDILKALEGPCCLVECVEDDEYCERIPLCVAHDVWKEASSMLKNYFENISLEDLVKRSKEKTKKEK
jgi:Rrf2 family protein